MAEQDISMKNTKKEMLDIILKLQKRIEEKEKAKLNAEQIREETKKVKTVKQADKTAASSLSTEIHALKISINKELATLSDKIEAEAEKYDNLNQAIDLKQTELDEIYGIENGFDDIRMMGKTDPGILYEALKKHKLDKSYGVVSLFGASRGAQHAITDVENVAHVGRLPLKTFNRAQVAGDIHWGSTGASSHAESMLKKNIQALPTSWGDKYDGVIKGSIAGRDAELMKAKNIKEE